jgi:hypothetical protein
MHHVAANIKGSGPATEKMNGKITNKNLKPILNDICTAMHSCRALEYVYLVSYIYCHRKFITLYCH